jgi:hypothetical protein
MARGPAASARRGRRVATRWLGHERGAARERPGGPRARRGGGHEGQPRHSGGSGRVGCRLHDWMRRGPLASLRFLATRLPGLG